MFVHFTCQTRGAALVLVLIATAPRSSVGFNHNGGHFRPLGTNFCRDTPSCSTTSSASASADAACSSEGTTTPPGTADRSTLTLLEHVNLNVPDHDSVLPFFFDLMGFGLDPRVATNLDPTSSSEDRLIWANCGVSQFHLPYDPTPQVIPGHIGLRYESLDGLEQRLKHIDNDAESHQKCFTSYEIQKDEGSKQKSIKIIDNYGNVFVCREGPEPLTEIQQQPIVRLAQTEEWGDVATQYGLESQSECRSIDYLEFHCPEGTADKIALFYDSVFDATTTVVDNRQSKVALVAFGSIDANGRASQYLIFRETNDPIPNYDGHHIAMYVGESHKDFEQAFRNADLAEVVWFNPRFADKVTTLEAAREEKQFRFKDIVDMTTGEIIFELEHEIRSIEHKFWPGSKREIIQDR